MIGHNDHIAWGFTTTTSDVEDLFVEKVDPSDPGRYLTPAGSAPFETRAEKIIVRGASTIDFSVRATRHGPVLSDALPPDAADRGYVLALSATFLTPKDRSAEALWHADRATDWPSFRAAWQNFVGPMTNIVYADDSGTIGFIAPGLVPIRGKGEGWMPAPGWTGEYDWQGFIPFDKLPSAVNPPSGHFVSANNKIVPDSYPYFLSRDWDLPNRAERIEALLAATPIQSPASSAAIEADTFSLMAKQLVPLMTQITPADEPSRAAIARLKQWDFRMDRDKVEPLLFTAWLREFSHAILFGRFGDAVAGYWDLKPRVMEAVLTERPDWCADPKRPGAVGCAARLAQALKTALSELRSAYGDDMATWQWGKAHIAVFANPVLSRIPVLRDWFGVSISTPGAYDTLNRGPSIIRDDRRPFEQVFGAGLRIITDLASPADARMIITPGQSGNPLSPDYANLLQPWRDFGWLYPGHDRHCLDPRTGPCEMNDLPVTIADIRRAAAAIAGAVERTPTIAAPGAVRARRLRDPSEARNPAPDRLVQGTRGAEQIADPRPGAAAGRRRRDVGRQPCPRGGLSRPAPRYPGNCRHARGHPVHQDRAHRRLGRRCRAEGRQPRRRARSGRDARP